MDKNFIGSSSKKKEAIKYYSLGHCGGLKLPNTFSSYIDASAINKKYQTIKIMPRRRSSFHPFKCTDINKNTTVDNSDRVE